MKYGSIVSVNQDETTIEEIMIQNSARLNQMMKMEVEKSWDEYY